MLKALKNWRVILLIVFLVLAFMVIRPAPFAEGVVIKAVSQNSSAAEAGITGPKANTAPLGLERIESIDSIKISSITDYYNAISGLEENQTIRIITDKGSYLVDFNGEMGLKVAEAPTSNIRKGLDLAGGSRVLLRPAEEVSQEDLQSIIQSLTQRLNVYGLSDVSVRDATDLSGNKFILIEIAGLTEEEVKNIIVSQGKFEAKIKNQTVFVGGKKDITYVCRTADCSGLDPRNPCQRYGEQWACGFSFTVSLSPEAAERHAQITRNLSIVTEGSQRYLSSALELYLDDKLVDTLQIAADLKGKTATQVAVSGSGSGRTQQEAANSAIQNMKRLQTIIITGSLPVKLEIVKIDTVSPILGEKFMKNILTVGLLAIAAVGVIVALRYRELKIVLPMVGIMLSEVVLILGFAAMVGWNLDIAAMAGILISIGTAVDHLIVITDETIKGEVVHDWKRRVKNAMFIIMGAYLTVVAGMLPLWFAGAGLLKGFAFTTIMGVSFGVFIARPAYAVLLKELVGKEL